MTAATMVALKDLVQTVQNGSQLLLSQIIALVLLLCRLKNDILLLYPSSALPGNTPPTIPDKTVAFIKETCLMSEQDVEACWEGVNETVWNPDPILSQVLTEEQIQLTFQKHGGKFYRT